MHQDDWDRLRTRLFPADEPRNEAFVARVMARVNDDEKLKTQSSKLRGFDTWLTPAVGFAFAALFLIYARPQSADAGTFSDSSFESASFQDLQSGWSYTADASETLEETR